MKKIIVNDKLIQQDNKNQLQKGQNLNNIYDLIEYVLKLENRISVLEKKGETL